MAYEDYSVALDFGDWETTNDPSADYAFSTKSDEISISTVGRDVSVHLLLDTDQDAAFLTPREAEDVAFALMRAARVARMTPKHA